MNMGRNVKRKKKDALPKSTLLEALLCVIFLMLGTFK